MHEFAITKSLIHQVISEAERRGASKVKRVKVLIGENSSVVPECVQFYFERLKNNTIVAQATLEFQMVPLCIRCPKCGKEFQSIEDMCECNAGGEIIRGEELIIESIDIED